MVFAGGGMTYLIAELGQNMQGSLQVALDLIRIAAEPQRHDFYGPSVGGVDAVKLTKRALGHELTRSGLEAEYSGVNSFGRTYGEHRRELELADAEHGAAYEYAKDLGLDFIETICAPQAMSVLRYVDPDYLKVASRDLTNHRLLNALAETKKPLILSTGMAGPEDLDAALEVVVKHHEDITILHCVSQYPTEPDQVNLATIQWLQETYPFYRVGYSDHTQGVWAPIAAVAMGAKVIEKHVTLDRMMRGSDHRGALDRDGIYRWVRDTRLVEKSIGYETMFKSESTHAARSKLERSVATAQTLPEGHTISEDDIEPLSPGTGIPWPERDKVVGGVTVQEVAGKELLSATMVRA